MIDWAQRTWVIDRDNSQRNQRSHDGVPQRDPPANSREELRSPQRHLRSDISAAMIAPRMFAAAICGGEIFQTVNAKMAATRYEIGVAQPPQNHQEESHGQNRQQRKQRQDSRIDGASALGLMMMTAGDAAQRQTIT